MSSTEINTKTNTTIVKTIPPAVCFLPLCLLLAALLLLVPATAVASQGVGFRISPTYINPTLAAGEETRETVTLQNSSGDPLAVKISTRPSDESAAFIGLDQEQVALNPGESKTVAIRIGAASDAMPGTWEQAVFFDAAASGEANVSIIGRVSVILDVSVIRSVEDVQWKFPHLIDSTEEAVFEASGRNSGKFSTRLEEKVDLAGLFSESTIVSSSDPVPIGESGNLQAIWQEAPLFSAKRTTLSLSSGTGTPANSSALIIVFPWRLSLMLALMAMTASAGAGFRPDFTKVFASKRRKAD